MLTTPPGSGTVTPRAEEEPPKRDRAGAFKLGMASLVSVLILILAFIGIFTNFGYTPCSCDSLRPYFIGLVTSVLTWWAPSPLK